MRLPGADELFRATTGDADPAGQGDAAEPAVGRRDSGRVKHDEKVTVYMTADELHELEQARLSLRRELAQTVDRGRLVRAAVSIALADLDEHGNESALVQKLRTTVR